VISGLYASATCLLNGQKALDVVVNNLANVNVPAFKQQRTTFRSFPDIMLQHAGPSEPSQRAIGKVGGGARVDEIRTSFHPGQLNFTGNQDDLAISGDGFFQVLTDKGVRYTRNGSFSRDTQGVLRASDGSPVMGKGGLVYIGEQSYQVKSNGDVVVIREEGGVVTEQLIDTVDLVEVTRPEVLKRVGNSQFELPPEYAHLARPATGTVLQGYLEQANISVVSAMVRMIDAFRTYETSQRAIHAIDETLKKAVNEVAKVS